MRVLIGFSTAPDAISRTIRWATNAPCSHTFLLLEDCLLGEDMVVEAAWDGIRMIPFHTFQRKNKIVALVNPRLDCTAGVKFALENLGVTYNYSGLFGMAWVQLGRWLGKAWRNPLRSPKSLFCSEANTRILQVSGYPGADKLDPQSTSPEDLLRFLSPSQAKLLVRA